MGSHWKILIYNHDQRLSLTRNVLTLIGSTRPCCTTRCCSQPFFQGLRRFPTDGNLMVLKFVFWVARLTAELQHPSSQESVQCIPTWVCSRYGWVDMEINAFACSCLIASFWVSASASLYHKSMSTHILCTCACTGGLNAGMGWACL